MLAVIFILVVAIALFITERLRVDGVALLVLAALVFSGLLDVQSALAGFGNPAVVTIAAMFVLSGGLYRTGIANLVGKWVLRVAGGSDAKLVAVIMISVGAMSGFMNDIGVAALMLPVVMDIARRTGRSPSKLLIPLSFAALMGGKTTLIGTAANILLSASLVDYGLEPFALFDFLPIGMMVMATGIAYMILVGTRLLPTRETPAGGEGRMQDDLAARYGLRDRLHVVRVPDNSPLAGHSLRQSRIGSALDLNVIAIMRDRRIVAAPVPETRIRGGDRLLVEGPFQRFDELVGIQHLVPADLDVGAFDLAGDTVGLAEVEVSEDSPLLGQSLQSAGFRKRFGAIVLAMRQGGEIVLTRLEHRTVSAGDTLLIQAERDALETIIERGEIGAARPVEPPEAFDRYHLSRLLRPLRIPAGSALAGKSLVESRLGDAYRMGVLGILRGGELQLLVDPDERLEVDDILLVKARPLDLAISRGLIELELEAGPPPDLADIDAQGVGLMEVVLSPNASATGNTLRGMRFRDKFGVSVLALTRAGEVYDANRRDMEIRFGDGLLLFGDVAHLRKLGMEGDFIALTAGVREAPKSEKAPLAALILFGVVGAAISGLAPIAVAALFGALLMVLTGCLDSREAYRVIEWPAIILVAGMLPLGLAMESTGLAGLVAERVVSSMGAMGPFAIMAALFWLTVAAAQVMPTAVVAVLMAPIAINSALQLGYSPHSMLMLIAMAVSSSFMTPVGHAVNVLVMGPGGYRFTDYAKVGLPLTIVVFLTVMTVMPWLWPLVSVPPG